MTIYTYILVVKYASEIRHVYAGNFEYVSYGNRNIYIYIYILSI